MAAKEPVRADFPKHAPTARKFGEIDRLIQKRMAANISIKDIAKEIGIGEKTLRRWHAPAGRVRDALYSDEKRELAKRLAGVGCNDEQIAAILKISSDALHDHMQAELTEGRAEASARVKETLYQMAVSGEQPHSTMFWLKCRDGWRDRDEAPATQVQVATTGPVEVSLGGRRLEKAEGGVTRLVDER